MQNQNWIQVSQYPQSVSQMTPRQNSWYLSRSSGVCILLSLMFGVQILCSGIAMTAIMGGSFVVVLIIGMLLMGSGIFCCVKSYRARKEALLTTQTAYNMVQAQGPQYPVAAVPGPMAMAGIQPPPQTNTNAPPSYYLASAPIETTNMVPQPYDMKTAL